MGQLRRAARPARAEALLHGEGVAPVRIGGVGLEVAHGPDRSAAIAAGVVADTRGRWRGSTGSGLAEGEYMSLSDDFNLNALKDT